jgi:hypothetical protein
VTECLEGGPSRQRAKRREDRCGNVTVRVEYLREAALADVCREVLLPQQMLR